MRRILSLKILIGWGIVSALAVGLCAAAEMTLITAGGDRLRGEWGDDASSIVWGMSEFDGAFQFPPDAIMAIYGSREKGKDKEVKNGFSSTFREIVQKELDEKIKEEYSEFDEDDLSFLEIEYKIDGFGNEENLHKRHRLENRMNETLGWTGLGHTDGGSIGSGTMEVGCIVVDFEIAKKVIMEDLENTEFENYTRIFEMK